MADLTNRLVFDIRPALRAVDRVGAEVEKLADEVEDAFDDVQFDVDFDTILSDISKIEKDLRDALDGEADLDLSDLDRASREASQLASDLDIDAAAEVRIDALDADLDAALDRIDDLTQTAQVDIDVDDSEVQGLFESLSTFARTGAAAAGVAIGAALTAGLTSALDGEEATLRLQAQLGATEEGVERLADIATEVFRDGYGDSLGDATESVRLFADQFGELGDITDDELERVITQTLALQETFDVDLQGSLRAAGQLVQSGLAADFDEAFDVITTGFQNGLNESDDFLDSLVQYAPNIRDLGLNLDDFLSLLGTGLDAGAFNTDKIADAFKELGIQVRDETPGVAEAFATLGLSQTDFVAALEEGGPTARAATLEILAAVQAIEDPILQNVTAIGLFGTQSEELGPTVFNALDPAILQFQTLEGAADQMAETINSSVRDRIESFRREAVGRLSEFLTGTVFPAIEQYGPVILDVIGQISPAIFGLAGVISDLVPPEAFLDFWESLAEIVLEFFEDLDYEPLLEGLLEGWEAISDALEEVDWEQIFDNIAAAFEAFFRIASPVVQWMIGRLGPVFTQVGNLIASVVQIVSGVLAGDWQRAWQGVQGAASAAINAVSGIISSIDWAGLLGRIWDAIRDGAETAWAALPGLISDGLNAVGRLLGSVDWNAVLDRVWTAIRDAAQVAWQAVSAAVTDGLNAVGQLLRQVDWSALLERVWAAIVDAGEVALIALLEIVTDGLNAVSAFLADVDWDAVIDRVWDLILDGVGLAWEAISEAVVIGLNAIGTLLSNVDWVAVLDAAWEAIKAAVGLAWEAIKAAFEIGLSLVENVLEGAVDLFSAAGQALGDALMAGLSAAFGAAGDIGTSLINGIIDAINVGINHINTTLPDSINLPGLPDIDLPDNPIPNIPNLAQGAIIPATPGGVLVRAAENRFDELFLNAGASFGRNVGLLQSFDQGRFYRQLAALFGTQQGQPIIARQASTAGPVTHQYHLHIDAPPTQNPRIWARQLLAQLRRYQR